MISIKITKSVPSVQTPVKATPGSAGFDVRAFGSFSLRKGETVLVSTGLFLEIPPGYEVQIRSRSGLALKGVTVANSPGTIDSDFRGELKVLMTSSQSDFSVENGDRIAQMVVSKLPEAVFVEVSSLTETDRAGGGFGSTGISS